MKKIILTRNILLLIFTLSVILVQAQTKVIKGQLKGSDGSGLPGVNVIIKGSTTGTTTDIDGYYELEVPIGSTVVFSFIGMKTREMYIGPDYDDGKKKNSDRKNYRHTIPNDPEKTLSPYFFIKGDVKEGFGMPLKSTKVIANVTGIIADVEVKQVYVNNGTKPLEAIYIFPGSTRAAVHGMEMKVGNRVLKAVIQEKKEARQTYEKAKSEGKSATLLEQDRPNIFKMNIANIMPGDTIEVKLKYTETLDAINGIYEFVYPTVVGPRYNDEDVLNQNAETDLGGVQNENWVQNPYLSEGTEPTSTFSMVVNLNTGIPINQAFCKTHDVKVVYADKNRAQVILTDSETNGGNRDFILNYKLRGARTESGLILYEDDDEQYFLLMIEPPENAESIVYPDREYIFIVDVSGSMSGFPLNLSKRLMKGLLSDLEPTDKFNIMFFAGDNYLFSNKSVYASEVNVQKALHEVSKQSGGGGTELYSCLDKALAMKADPYYSRSFIVITDGFINVEKQTFDLISNNLNKANLFALGIGSSVNRHLIEGIAYAGKGEKFIITNQSSAESVGKQFLDYIKHPALTDIKVDFGDLDVYDFTPSAIPDLFLRRPVAIHGKYRGALDTPIKISGRNGEGLYMNIVDPKVNSNDQNEALKYLWARDKIKYLSDYSKYYEGNINGYSSYSPEPSDLVKKQIIKLGLDYNLLTNYTSFVAVDSIIRNETGLNDKVNQVLPLPKGMSDQGVQTVELAQLVMQVDAQELSEVVVVGYGVQTKSDITGAVSSVESEISNTGLISNVLQGRVAGVTITNSNGSPGAGATLRIRGNSSISMDSKPLYVVDGVPTSESNLINLDPNQISSISVLKDAASTAIYGSRGANGVIIVTTKDKSYQNYIELNSQFLLSSAGNLPGIQNQYGMLTENTSFYNPKNYGWGDILGVPADEVKDRLNNGIAFSNTIEIARKIKDHQLNLSFNHTNEENILDNEKKVSNLVTNYKYSKNNYTTGFDLHLTGVNQDLTDNLFGPSRYIQGIYSIDQSSTLSPTDTNNFSNSKSWLALNSMNEFNQRNGNGEIYLEKEFEKFKLRLAHAVNLNKDRLITGYGTGVAGISQGYFFDHSNDITDNGSEFSVNHNFQREDFKLDSRLMSGYYHRSIYSDINFFDDQLTMGNFETTNYLNQVYESIDTTQSRWLTNLENRFSFNDFLAIKYALTLESNSFFKENLLPSHSMGLSLIITELVNMSNQLLSNLKVRSSMNASKVGYNYLGKLQFSNPILSMMRFNSSPNLYLPYLDENLVPENRKELNLGIDAGFLSDRITLTADYYITDIENQIGNNWTNSELEISNLAHVKKQGLELSLSSFLISGDFSWSSDFSFTRERSEVLSITSGATYQPIAGFVEAHTALVVGEQLGTLVTTNDDGTISVIGTPNPNFNLSMVQNFSYKGFDLNVTMQYKNGGQVWNGTRAINDYLGLSTQSLDFRSESNIPDYSQDLNYNANEYVEDASLLRLSHLSLSYRFHNSIAEKLHLKDLRLTVFTNNLFLISSYDGVDPENTISGDFLTYGIDLYNRPSSRSFGVGLKIKF